MLVLDVLHDWVPASVVVDLVTITWGIDNVQSQTNAVLLDDVGNSLDFGSRANWLIWRQTSLGIDEVRSEDSVDESGLSKTGLS